MRCDNCGQRSDWIGEASAWRPVHGERRATRALYRCERCGGVQWSK